MHKPISQLYFCGETAICRLFVFPCLPRRGICVPGYAHTAVFLCVCASVYLWHARAVDSLDNPLYSHSYFCRFSMYVWRRRGGGGMAGNYSLTVTNMTQLKSHK